MEGKLVIEVYEYSEEADQMPVFEYIPCDLSKCIRGKSASLKEIIERGFDDLPKKAQDSEKRQEVLRKVEEAGIGKIDVAFHPAKGNADDCVELTNVVPVSFTYADARQQKKSRDEIILKGRYRLSAGNEVTTLRDAQRLTLIYSSTAEAEEADGADEEAEEKVISMNITYLQE